MFALVDVNSFYTSCETIFRPDLRGRPVVVLSNNDGCIISLSREARQLSLNMGAPYFKLREELQRHNVVVFSSNYALYADMSNRVMETLERLAPRIDVYSIDEAFLDLTGVEHCMPLAQFGHDVRDTLLRETHLTVGVGIAPTKTLAKLANYAAKKWTKTGGVLDLSSTVRQQKLMALLAVDHVWGIGQRLSKKLNQMGIKTALQLANTPTALIRKHFGVVVERTVRELRGESCLMFEEVIPGKQHILCSRSFSSRITDYAQMREAICSYAVRAAEKLRHERQYCREVGAFIRTSPHDDNHPYYANSASSRLLTPTQDSRDIINRAVYCLDAIWRPEQRYMKGGVMLGDFFSQGIAQFDLFDPQPPRRNSEQLMSLLDKHNQQGRGTLWFAGQGIQQQWQMKRDFLSPAYTTQLNELPVAKIK
ncbi:DNA polymerase V subunit UmuC [[Pantoea] beijingensis]|uniref:DNA polymerase V subunit UmuC n=1 Tax=[Pantoea] beijingensis TaxID=1324864 RepID=A0A443IIP6_9GAMM|nr:MULTISPECIES: translesion error-prone DNA polymerase V subunit UmuC [Erwiniaceae]RWR03881.1 DNA polymerase V subunit UmuC [[Pantoea] beijingensis]